MHTISLRRGGACICATLSIALSSCGGGDAAITLEAAAGRPNQQDVFPISPEATVSAPQGVFVTNITRVSSIRMPKRLVQQQFVVSVKGGPQALSGIKVYLKRAANDSTINDGLATIETLPSSAIATSGDVIIVTQESTKLFDPTTWQWAITSVIPGALGALDRSASLSGTDSNSNGIRDDIDLYIAELNLDQHSRDAVQDLARGYQLALQSSTTEQALLTLDRIVKAQNCLAFRSPNFTALSKAVMALNYNTEARFRQYIQFDKLLSTGSTVPPRPVAIPSCS